MVKVVVLLDAQKDIGKLPTVIKARVQAIVTRLASWPNVSGAKPMTGNLAGYFRIRTGDWRVLFRVEGDVIIVKVQHRSEVYDD